MSGKYFLNAVAKNKRFLRQGKKLD